MFRAVEFERRSSSGDVFNAVNAAFRRSVSQRFERVGSSGRGFNLEYTGLRPLLFYLADPLKSYCYW